LTFDPAGERSHEDQVVISGVLSIPLRELHFRFSRSGGPGGQHVNRTETRVELLFDVQNSPSLGEGQRARLIEHLAGRLDRDGVLHIVSSSTRSQAENRADAIARFQALLHSGLKPRKKRLATQPTAGGRERRLAGKHHRSTIKSQRRHDLTEDM
jgi:ribosome-associated protein